MIETIVSVVVSLLVGAYVTYRVSRYYYQRASENLRQEAGELRHYVNVLIAYLHSLELDPRVTLGYDESGRISHVRVERTAAASPRSSSSASGTLQHYPEDQGRTDSPQEAEEGPA